MNLNFLEGEGTYILSKVIEKKSCYYSAFSCKVQSQNIQWNVIFIVCRSIQKKSHKSFDVGSRVVVVINSSNEIFF